MRTIPQPTISSRPGMATVGFLKICGSLEKMYMNPTLKIPIKQALRAMAMYAEAHTCTRQVRSSGRCEEVQSTTDTTDVIAVVADCVVK